MAFEHWCILLGALLLAMGLGGSLISKLPVTAAMFYFAVGLIVGPTVLGAIHIDPRHQSVLLERLSEVAVVVSLFTAGLKLRIRFSDSLWNVPVRLAFLSMALTVGMIAVVGVYLLGLPLGAAVLLGAILAPTDPVLASSVQIQKAGEREPLRFALTGEAGLNDGTSFPFVMLGLGLLGLHDLGDLGLQWVIVDVLYAGAGGLILGAAFGFLTGEVVLYLRRKHREGVGYDEFLALGLIALSYGVAVQIHVYGFLSVFAAGLALRAIERRHSGEKTSPEIILAGKGAHRPHEAAVHPKKAPAFMTEAILYFNQQAEHLIEVALVFSVGLMLSLGHLPGGAWALAALILFVIRPLASFIGLYGSTLDRPQQCIVSWLGIRGIGSIYYLMYALNHGLPGPLADKIVPITLLIVAISVFVHGITATPIMQRYHTRSTN
jgi:NhaP-type Na+/H+ or K+/H+ antiporter